MTESVPLEFDARFRLLAEVTTVEPASNWRVVEDRGEGAPSDQSGESTCCVIRKIGREHLRERNSACTGLLQVANIAAIPPCCGPVVASGAWREPACGRVIVRVGDRPVGKRPALRKNCRVCNQLAERTVSRLREISSFEACVENCDGCCRGGSDREENYNKMSR